MKHKFIVNRRAEAEITVMILQFTGTPITFNAVLNELASATEQINRTVLEDAHYVYPKHPVGSYQIVTAASGFELPYISGPGNYRLEAGFRGHNVHIVDIEVLTPTEYASEAAQ